VRQRINQPGDAQEKAQKNNDDDCTIERAESRLFGTVGWNERGAYNVTAFVLAVSYFGHAGFASIARATLGRAVGSLKVESNDLVWNEQS
jgi:hypothetical protein